MKNIKKLFIFVLSFMLVVLPHLALAKTMKIPKLSLTPEEQEYVDNCGPITVLLSPDNYPYSSLQKGKVLGVFPEMLALISYKTGIEFEIVPVHTYEEYDKLRNNQGAAIIFATHLKNEEAKTYGYKLTKPYINIPFSKIELKRGDKEAGSKIGALKRPSPEATEAGKYFYSDQIVYCDSKAQALTSLDNGLCEAIIVNSYDAEHIQYYDQKNQYIVKELYDNLVPISAGIRHNEDPMLMELMQKALDNISATTKEEIINRNTQHMEREVTLENMVYSNPEVALGIGLAFLTLLTGIILLSYRNKQNKLIEKRAAEYKRFIGYICTSVDAVTELDVFHKTMRKYTMLDGKLTENVVPYPPDPFVAFAPEDREKIREKYNANFLMNLCEHEETAYEECRMRWREGIDYQWCNCILQGIKPSADKPLNLMLMIKDTQAVKEQEAEQKKALEGAFALAKQASEAKGNFLSKMSHEIRTPLNAIIGYLGIAKDSDLNVNKIMHCVDNSEIAARRLLAIINDVLDISSIESGKMKIAQEDFDLKKEISDISAIFFQNAKAKGIGFEVHVEKLTQEWVVGDSLRLNQVLMNFLSNAIKFTPEGGKVILTIEQRSEDAKNVYVQFTVKDTGIGMSPEYMNRLFKPFEQESATTAQKYGGTGLGLSIAHNLVKMMGGDIQVQSTPGVGTTFSITINFVKSAHSNKMELAQADYAHVRVLVVDDHEDEGSYIRTMLKRCGVKAEAVTSGVKALKKIKARMEGDYRYDMCIVDWNMPEMNGVEVATRIREELQDQMPIIIATAYDITEIEDMAKAVGVNKVVAKPLFQSTLFDILVSTFGRYNPSTEEKLEGKEAEDLKGIHLILAEDNAMNMEIAVTILEKAGVIVDQAVNGQEAYDLLASKPAGTYDMILMDIQMPVLNGYEATKKIRESNLPEAKTIPIIAMTANAFTEDVTEALSRGMNAHIAKPISTVKLFELVSKFAKKNR